MEWTVPLDETCRDYYSRFKGCYLILSGTSWQERTWYPFENATWPCSSDSFDSLFYLSTFTAGWRASPRSFSSRCNVRSSKHFTIASEAIWICLIVMELYPLYLRFAYRDLSMSTLFLSRLHSLNGSIESVQVVALNDQSSVVKTIFKLAQSTSFTRYYCTSLRTTFVKKFRCSVTMH